MNTILRLALLTALCALGTASAAETAPTFPPHVLGNTLIRPVPRAANGRDYQLFIALPYGYASSTKKYPVVYICDGYWDFTLLNGFYGNLRYDQATPEFIIVGLGYQNATGNADYDQLRRYDYTPAPDGDDPRGERSGHAAEFLDVIAREIIPLVEREYRVDPSYRVLGGNSLGGCFTLYALFARPGLFQAHIAISPATPPGLLAAEEKFAASHQPLPARLFMSGAELEWPDFLAGIKRFNERLAARHYADLAYQWRLIDGEGHTTTKAESYTRGLRFAFAPLPR